MYISKASPNELLADLPRLIDIAKTQPKIGLDDPRVTESDGRRLEHEQYKGIFFRRFVEIKAVDEGSATRQQLTYIRMFKERFGLDLVLLAAEFSDTFGAIYDAIDAKKPYDELAIGRVGLLELEHSMVIPEGTTASLDNVVQHPFGIEAIGMHYWDKFNPLLETAYKIIESRNLNVSFLAKE